MEINSSHEDRKIFQREREPSISNMLCMDFKISKDGDSNHEEIHVTSFIRDGKLSKNVTENMSIVSEHVKEQILCMEERNEEIFDEILDYNTKGDSICIQDVINKNKESNKDLVQRIGDKNIIKVKNERQECFDLDMNSEDISDGLFHGKHYLKILPYHV